MDGLYTLKASNVPPAWRPVVRGKWWYALSCWFFIVPLSVFHDGDLIGRQMPILRHTGVAYVFRYFWPLQAWLR